MLPSTKLPSNWQSFLRLDENKKELFRFLSYEVIKLSDGIVVATVDEKAISNNSSDLSNMSPCNHEEADTRMLLHAKDASLNGLKRVMIRTVDTDVLVIAIAMFSNLDLSELWLLFGIGKNQKVIPVHSIYSGLGEAKSKSLPFFHAFTGCDQVSFFSGRGKKVAWNAWNQYELITSTFLKLSNRPLITDCNETFPAIEKFVSLMYDRTNMLESVDQSRKVLFARKGRSLEGIPPTSDALLQHTKRAVYQAGYCWSQSLVCQQILPDPNEWGWKYDEGNHVFTVSWMTIPQASAICHELARCGCNKDKGCKGRCKCRKASLQCTALCKCGGDCVEQFEG